MSLRPCNTNALQLSRRYRVCGHKTQRSIYIPARTTIDAKPARSSVRAVDSVFRCIYAASPGLRIFFLARKLAEQHLGAVSDWTFMSDENLPAVIVLEPRDRSLMLAGLRVKAQLFTLQGHSFMVERQHLEITVRCPRQGRLASYRCARSHH